MLQQTSNIDLAHFKTSTDNFNLRCIFELKLSDVSAAKVETTADFKHLATGTYSFNKSALSQTLKKMTKLSSLQDMFPQTLLSSSVKQYKKHQKLNL